MIAMRGTPLHERLMDWPTATDGTLVMPGERVKAPGTKTGMLVQSITFGPTPGVAYVNGFEVRRDERLGRFDERRTR